VAKKKKLNHYGPVGKQFIAYKKIDAQILNKDGTLTHAGYGIAKLLVPANAMLRSGQNEYVKIRVSMAYVMSITPTCGGVDKGYDPKIKDLTFRSMHDWDFVYKVGEFVFGGHTSRRYVGAVLKISYRRAFSPKRNDCGYGIHCYYFKNSAENH